MKLRRIRPAAAAAVLALVTAFTLAAPAAAQVSVPAIPWFIQDVRIAGGVAPCDTCAPIVCSGRPLDVLIRGTLPDGCWAFEGMGLDATPTFAATPPTIDVFLRHRSGNVCTPATTTFSGVVTLPWSPPGRWPFIVREVIVDSLNPPGASLSRDYSFVAGDSCGPPGFTCVWPFLAPVPNNREGTSLCNLSLFPGETGTIAFAAHSDSLPLAGLQGVIGVSPTLTVTGIRPIGPAAGMHLLTHRNAGGEFEYVLYADAGAPVPAGQGTAILEVGVRADSSLHAGDTGYVSGTVTAASDSTATSLMICPIMTLRWAPAIVCIRSPATCDANGDGHTNVADLVGMARCWSHPESCPDSAAMSPDCTGDGAFHLDDILCCARAILGAGPGGGTAHDAIRLRVSFGEAQALNGRVRVPLVIRGATEMNGALLRVRFPGDRYTAAAAAGADGLSARSTWMPLTEPGSDDVVVGVLRLDDAAQDEVRVELEFTLKPGQAPGGTLSIDQASVVAPDGSTLRVDLAQAVGTLPTVDTSAPVANVELLAGPNPSNGLTHFTVQLPAAGVVDLSIYDLAGRRVTTLWHGAMDAGQRQLTWDGTVVRRGIYFARLSVNGLVRTRRVLLQPAP